MRFIWAGVGEGGGVRGGSCGAVSGTVCAARVQDRTRGGPKKSDPSM